MLKPASSSRSDRPPVSPARSLIVLSTSALLLLFACNAPQKISKTPAAEPQTRATVLTIQTTLQPANKTFTHTLAIANGRARSSDEVDGWRLFDLAQKRVTFVDDLRKTYRNVPFQAAIDSRRTSLAQQPRADHMPVAELKPTGATHVIQGVVAAQSIIRLGGYERQLWIAQYPAVPPELFAIMQATQPITSPMAAVTRPADEALMNMQGFPLADHAELVFGRNKFIVDSTVVKVEQRDIPQRWLNVRSDYQDVTAPASPPPAGVQSAERRGQ